MTTEHVVYKTAEVAGDGSQALYVTGRDTPFNATAEWLRAQNKEPEVGDLLVEAGRNAHRLEAATEESTAVAEKALESEIEEEAEEPTQKKTVGSGRGN